MSGEQLNGPTIPAMNRRRFIVGVGAALAGGSLLGAGQGCGGDAPGVTALIPTGQVRGTVADLSGVAKGIGRIYLLKSNGLNTGTYSDVDLKGRFDFGQVPIGDFLLRYWGSNHAEVPEPLHNPVRITVTETVPVTVDFRIVVGENTEVEREIYIGDYFFQEQPIGPPNGTVTVKIGTNVCWYNVGAVVHNVSGGPWELSGPIGLDGNFMWTADRVGTFPYRCTLHGTQMIATLQIVP